LDSAEPRCRRKIDKPTMAATATNSLCQFCIDSNQNCDVVTYCHTETVACPCSICSSLNAVLPPTACNASEAKNSRKKAMANEFS
jgi:hypothetical protein